MSDPTVGPPAGPPGTASTFEYKYLELQGVLGSGEIIDPVNTLGADGWRVMSFEFSAGVYRVLMERQLT